MHNKPKVIKSLPIYDDDDKKINSNYGICEADNSFYLWFKSHGKGINSPNKDYKKGLELIVNRLRLLGIDKFYIYTNTQKGKIVIGNFLSLEKYNEGTVKNLDYIQNKCIGKQQNFVFHSDSFSDAILLKLSKKTPIIKEENKENINYGSQIKARRGQAEFRKKLLDLYESCVITHCSAHDTLEAAHIIPFSKEPSYELSNGLLLRSDIHTLFDLNLIRIVPKKDKIFVKINNKLEDKSPYNEFDNYEIELPKKTNQFSLNDFLENLKRREDIMGDSESNLCDDDD